VSRMTEHVDRMLTRSEPLTVGRNTIGAESVLRCHANVPASESCSALFHYPADFQIVIVKPHTGLFNRIENTGQIF